MTDAPPTLCDKPHCHAKLKNRTRGKGIADGRCHQWPVRDSKRCSMHGGLNPQSRLKAAQVQLERNIGRAVEKLGFTPVANPLVELQTLAGRVTAWVDVCQANLSVINSMGYETEAGEQVRAEILVWERALDRAVSTLATLAKLNIDARLAAIEERQAEKVENAFAVAMSMLGLDLEQRAEVESEFAKQLRLVAG